MRQIEILLNEYGHSHTNKFNILIHIAVIPMLIYYFRLSGPIGAAMTLLSVVSLYGIMLIERSVYDVWMVCLVLFVVMWILQFVGHKVEGKSPSFLKDVQFLLVGPAWWWVHWLKRMNIPY